MKILILSFYYAPDLSAGSFRTTSLVESLVSKLPEGSHIDVLTTLPNRYSSFSTEAPSFEKRPKYTVNRIAIPSHKSGIFDQSVGFIHYAWGVLRLIRGNEYDLVFATSSRLMTAILGWFVSLVKGAPLYLDIRDIFVDTINDVFSKKMIWFVLPLFSFLEKCAVVSANKINLVSRGFEPYFLKRYPNKRFSYFTNGIDDDFLNFQVSSGPRGEEDLKHVVYAGNMGEGQGLHLIIPQLAKRFEGKLRFTLIGDGGRKEALLAKAREMDCTNVEILPAMKRTELLKVYESADVLFLHLNDYEAFKKVLPSKLFEYAATGKPIWAGVSGYASEFIKLNIDNAAVFDPCNLALAEEAFSSLKLSDHPRVSFVAKYARKNIMSKMASDLLKPD